MPYQLNQTEVNSIAAALKVYYDAAWQDGIKNVVANMGRSQMGLVSKYLDVAKDSYANLKRSSGDSFRVTFKAELKQQIGLFLANKNDVAQTLVTVGEKVVDKLASMIPVPHLGMALSGAVGFAAGKAKDELHDRSITEADKMLMAQSGGELEKLFASDKETARFIDDSMKQYKTLTNYIGMLPTNVTSFDDAITFPKSAFKVQQAASSLNVALWSIRQYCAAMQERLAECQRMSEQYIATVRDKMPQVVGTVLIDAYNEGLNKGKSDAQIGKHSAPQPPKAIAAKPGAGGATLLANAMALALAQGYYDAGKAGPAPTMAPLRPLAMRR